MQVSRAGSTPSLPGPSMIPNAFTGSVNIDSVLSAPNASVTVVNFSPNGRTYWHTHEGGQILTVLAGWGWVCDEGAKPVRIQVGDVVYCPPGTTHWHGADEESYMVHQAVSLGGVEWGIEVRSDDLPWKGNATV